MVGLTASRITTPSDLDEATTLVRAEPMGSQLLLTARANTPLALTTDEGHRRAVNTTCANPAFLTILHYGASVRIVYLDRHKRDIGAVMVTRQICGFS